MKITVLRGGPSAEREVSLVSGAAVAMGLRESGHDVFESDVGPDFLEGIDQSKHPCDVIFPVLHGQFGESGELQEILEARGLKFVGSGSKASRLGMNKVETKRVWERAGLPTPSYEFVMEAKTNIAPPCVVKAIDSGSSVDVFVCKTNREADDALRKIVTRHGRALVETFIDGPELSVSVFEEEPLAPIRIIPKRGFYDFAAKYKADDTEHRFDTGLPDDVVQTCRQLARRANAIVGARDLGRVDIMLDKQFNPNLLEINTLPGFTSKSLFPEAAAHAGIPFAALVDRLARRALARI